MPRDPNAPPAPPPTAPPKRSAAGVAAICAAAALACLPLTQGSEGLRNRPYLDPAHILTVCYGETQGIDPARIYSTDDCAGRLRRRLAQDYAPRIAAANCLPQVATERRVKVFAALLDAAYNAGPVAVCNSRMARSIRAGDWGGGCNGFAGWYTTARDRRTGQRMPLKGLVTRRGKEAALCREGL
jgi:lysozyme